MWRKAQRRVLVVAVLGLFSLATGQVEAGGLIAVHQGDADPTTEGFSLWAFNGGISASAIPNDMGLPAWSITSTTPGSQQAAYLASLSPSQETALVTDGFTMSLEARAVSGPVYSSPGNQPIDAAIVGLGSVRYDLELGLNANGDTVAILASSVGVNGDGSFNVPGPSVTLPGNGYHLYQLALNPSTHTADLYIDGVDRIQGYAGHTDNLFTGFYFGALNHGTGNFNLAGLETGFTVVPEPSSLVLGAIGLASCAAWAMRRRAA